MTLSSMIDERTIGNILDRIDIVDVVRRYVPDLRQKGSNYQCCCPFHQERTPSFIVNKARNTWHCFGACAEGGDAIKFVMKYNHVTFPEAVRELAGMCGVTIEESEEKPTVEQEQLNKKREAMLIAYQVLQQFFVALGQPTTLRELGFNENSPLEEMAKKGAGEGFLGNFKPLYWQDVLAIYKACL